MAVTWDQTTYDQMYAIRIRDPNHPQFGQKVGYSRLGMARAGDPYNDNLDLYGSRWSKLTSLFNMQTADRVLIAGCGFGFLIEVAHAAGYPNVWGIDNSPYIENRKGVEADDGIVLVSEDIRGGGTVRKALRDETGDDEFDWIISESVMESYDDSEVDQLLNASEAVLTISAPMSNIIHLIVTDPMPAPLITRTLAEANALRPSHSWVSLNTWDVL